MKKPEILAPADNLEKLKTAIDFGADAVYIGGGKLSLKAFSNNLTNEELLEGVKYCHDRNKKIYITLNVFARNCDLEYAEQYIKELYDNGVDAIIVGDPSLIAICKQVAPKLEIHLSTQANTVNWATTKFWYELGVKRVTLAKELTFGEISTITEHVSQDCEIEVFVHGSMCIAYSARRLISNYMFGSDKNNRISSNSYRYHLSEETRPGEYYYVIEDDKGSYIMNSKDLCMIKYIPELVKSGVCSFKIEGRMKSTFYVASVVKAYREALDSYFDDPENFEFRDEWMDILKRVNHRQYDTGFFLGKSGEQNYDEESYIADYKIVGMVKEYDNETKEAIILQKSIVSEHDSVEVLRANSSYFDIKLTEMYDLCENIKIDSANRDNMIFKVKVEIPLQKNDMLIKRNIASSI